MPTTAASKGVPVSLLDAAVSGTGAAIAIPITSNMQRITVTGVGTLTTGNIILEEASSPTYSGLWSQLASLAANSLNGGAQQVYHISGTLGFIRARIDIAVTGGGTLAVELVSN